MRRSRTKFTTRRSSIFIGSELFYSQNMSFSLLLGILTHFLALTLALTKKSSTFSDDEKRKIRNRKKRKKNLIRGECEKEATEDKKQFPVTQNNKFSCFFVLNSVHCCALQNYIPHHTYIHHISVYTSLKNESTKERTCLKEIDD